MVGLNIMNEILILDNKGSENIGRGKKEAGRNPAIINDVL